jgi:exodeoxyribonuclease VII small subunit
MTASSPPNTGEKSSVELTFEEAVKRLSEIVQKLERGDLPLEKSLELFEEAIALSRTSEEKLDAARKRVDELLGVDQEGRPRTQPFETRGERDER